MRSPPMEAKSLENMSMKVFGCISLMSAPAAKAFSLPVTRMHPMLSSASRSSTAAAISRNRPNDSELSIFGRFRVMTPTAPLLSTMMCSNVLMLRPASDFASNVPAGGVGFKGVRCEEPTGRANARPMTGSATKQPSLPVQSLDCFAPPAMEKGGGVWLRHEHAGGGGHGQQPAET